MTEIEEKQEQKEERGRKTKGEKKDNRFLRECVLFRPKNSTANKCLFCREPWASRTSRKANSHFDLPNVVGDRITTLLRRLLIGADDPVVTEIMW